jgi:hypothetical protein
VTRSTTSRQRLIGHTPPCKPGAIISATSHGSPQAVIRGASSDDNLCCNDVPAEELAAADYSLDSLVQTNVIGHAIHDGP